MATIQKRGNSYLISSSCGYDGTGKQIRKTMTWKPDSGMTSRQEKKAVEAAAVRFEDQVQSGQYIDPTITFKEFTEKWLSDYAEPNLRADTVAGYKVWIPVLYQAIGHIKLSKLQPHHLAELYKSLSEEGTRRDMSYTPKFDLTPILQEKHMLKCNFAKQIGVSKTTLLQIIRRKSVSYKTAAVVCKALGLSLDRDFSVSGKQKLSGNTVLHYHNLIKSILSTAVKWQVIPSSPADRVAAPKKEHIEQECFDEQQTRDFIVALQDAPINRRTAAILLLSSGMRRSELYGLSWNDIDFDRQTISIHTTSVYVAHKGMLEGDTKNSSSCRVIKLPSICMPVLVEYRAWYNEQRLACGDQWQNSGRLFVTWCGSPEGSNEFTSWFRSFARSHGISEGIHPHSLRHTNATLQIMSHQDIRTVSARLGHSQTSTTLNVYAHAIQSADATAADALNDIFSGKQQINNK